MGNCSTPLIATTFSGICKKHAFGDSSDTNSGGHNDISGCVGADLDGRDVAVSADACASISRLPDACQFGRRGYQRAGDVGFGSEAAHTRLHGCAPDGGHGGHGPVS